MTAWLLVKLKENWRGLAVGLLLGFFLGGLRTGSEPQPAVVAQTGGQQAITGTAQAHTRAVVEAGGRPAMPCPPDKVCPECPPVKVVYDCGARVDGAAAQSIEAEVAVAKKGAGIGIWAGIGGEKKEGWSPYGLVAIQYNRLQLQGAWKPDDGALYVGGMWRFWDF